MSVAAYPPARKWTTVVSRQVVPGGVVLRIEPPWVGRIGLAALPAVRLVAAAVDSVTFAQDRAMSATLSVWGGVRVDAVGLLGWTLALAAIHRLRWRATLTAVGRHVTLTEQSPLWPGLAEWPAGEVAGVRMQPADNGQTADLVLDLADGTAAALWTGGRHRHVRLVCETMRVALNLHPRPAVAGDSTA